MRRGDLVRLRETGEVFTYAGIDGTCAKMMRKGDPVPCPVRLWGVHELFEREDGSSIQDEWWIHE